MIPLQAHDLCISTIGALQTQQLVFLFLWWVEELFIISATHKYSERTTTAFGADTTPACKSEVLYATGMPEVVED